MIKKILFVLLFFIIVIIALRIFFITEPSRGVNRGIKATLTNIRVFPQIYKDRYANSLENICTDPEVLTLLDQAKKYSKSTPTCFSDKDSFVVMSKFKDIVDDMTHWCVDSKGAAKSITLEQSTSITSSDTLCP